MFPIVFASVVGRLTMQVARWKLERGSSVDSLEQWLGSRTVFSAIYTQIRLSSLNVAAIFLALVWAISPLSTQSVQRLLDTGFVVNETNTAVKYFDTDAASNFANWVALSPGSASASQSAISLLRPFYVALLLAPDESKAAPTDLWGNLKIPLLSSYNLDPSAEWSLVPSDGSTIYSSLSGIPLATLPVDNSTFNVESSYIDLVCDNITTTPGFTRTPLRPIPSKQPGSNYTLINGTWSGYRANESESRVEVPTWFLGLDNFVDARWVDSIFQSNRSGRFVSPALYTRPAMFVNETGISASQATLLLGTTNKVGQPIFGSQASETLAYCKVLQPYVESRIQCSRSVVELASSVSTGPSCKVVAQRLSQKPHTSSLITHLSFPEVFSGVSVNLPSAVGVTTVAWRTDLSIYYLKNTSVRFMTAQDETIELGDIPKPLFSHRLTQLLNTYLLLSQTFDEVTGSGKIPLANNLTAPVVSQRLEDVYTVSWAWAVVFLVGSLVLLACSVAGAIFAHMAVTPEIMGYASSTVRDSRYIQLPPGAGTLDGLDLARALKGGSIQYGVIGGMEEMPPTLGVFWKGYVARASRGGRYQ
jgi:hypothetical protein